MPSRPDLSLLSRRMPGLESAGRQSADGRLLLQFKDSSFEKPILLKFASDYTLKMLACLTILHYPKPPGLIGIEEPENHFHPRLLAELSRQIRDLVDEGGKSAISGLTDGSWSLREHEGIDHVLPLEAIGVQLPLTAIYQGVDFTSDQ